MSLSPHVDRIELMAIRAVGTIGVLPEEQSRAQPFEIDLIIEFDARRAGETDELAATIDYGVPIAIAVGIVENEEHQLLERVVTRIAEDVLALDGVDAVEVHVRKLRPPVPYDIAFSAVRTYRRRADLMRVERPLATSYVALGSNLGDREATLRSAVLALPGVRSISGVYETAPVGGPEQGPYLNMVAELETRLDPYQLLVACRRVELAAGRERLVRWGPRTLDVDVLLYDDVNIVSEELTIPHPRMWERRFVLAPLAEIAPHRVPSDWDQRLPAAGVTRVGDLSV